VNALALPDNLIPLDSPIGQKLLARSTFRADYGSLTRNFESQSRRNFCGVATSVVVLNALHVPTGRLTQSTFFTPAVERVRSEQKVTYTGMGLGDLAALLRAHNADATAIYASDLDVEGFRAMAKENLRTKGDFILANYQRAALGQQRMAHISPIAAYDEASDRFLVLDVASYKYPPVWVQTEDLWKAISTVANKKTGRTRGVVVVRPRSADEAEPAGSTP
jgi:hypothetical protein